MNGRKPRPSSKSVRPTTPEPQHTQMSVSVVERESIETGVVDEIMEDELYLARARKQLNKILSDPTFVATTSEAVVSTTFKPVSPAPYATHNTKQAQPQINQPVSFSRPLQSLGGQTHVIGSLGTETTGILNRGDLAVPNNTDRQCVALQRNKLGDSEELFQLKEENSTLRRIITQLVNENKDLYNSIQILEDKLRESGSSLHETKQSRVHLWVSSVPSSFQNIRTSLYGVLGERGFVELIVDKSITSQLVQDKVDEAISNNDSKFKCIALVDRVNVDSLNINNLNVVVEFLRKSQFFDLIELHSPEAVYELSRAIRENSK